MHYPIIALLCGSHGLSARRAWSPKPKAGQNGRNLEVGAWRASRLLVFDIRYLIILTFSYLMCLSSEFIHLIHLMFDIHFNCNFIYLMFNICLFYVNLETTYSMNLSSQFNNCLNHFLKQGIDVKNWLHIFVHQIAWFVENGTDMYLHCKISPHFSHQRTFPNSPTNAWIYLHKILNWDKVCSHIIQEVPNISVWYCKLFQKSHQ